MPFIETTISPDYRNNWGKWECIREFAQNARDAETVHGCVPSMSWSEYPSKGGRVRIESIGKSIGRETMLLGVSDKRDDDRTIGYRAEGYKLGALAGVRAGLEVVITTGDERWRAAIRKSRKFGVDVFGRWLPQLRDPPLGGGDRWRWRVAHVAQVGGDLPRFAAPLTPPRTPASYSTPQSAGVSA